MKTKKLKYSGFTLIEILLVVGLIAISALLAFVVYPKARATSRANIEITTINTLLYGIKNLFVGNNNFAGLNHSLLINSKILPDKILVGNNSNLLVNGFGGEIIIETLTLTSINSLSDNSFRITWQSVPEVECIKIATGVANNFMMLNINGNQIKSSIEETSNPVDIVNSCNQNDNNTLIMVSN